MEISFNFEHYCYECGKQVGVFVPIQKDAIRGVYIVKVHPCSCSTSKAPNIDYKKSSKSALKLMKSVVKLKGILEG